MIVTLAVSCSIAGLYLCWLHARADDRREPWGNRWGDPDHRIVDELEGPN